MENCKSTLIISHLYGCIITENYSETSLHQRNKTQYSRVLLIDVKYLSIYKYTTIRNILSNEKLQVDYNTFTFIWMYNY